MLKNASLLSLWKFWYMRLFNMYGIKRIHQVPVSHLCTTNKAGPPIVTFSRFAMKYMEGGEEEEIQRKAESSIISETNFQYFISFSTDFVSKSAPTIWWYFHEAMEVKTLIAALCSSYCQYFARMSIFTFSLHFSLSPALN